MTYEGRRVEALWKRIENHFYRPPKGQVVTNVDGVTKEDTGQKIPLL